MILQNLVLLLDIIRKRQYNKIVRKKRKRVSASSLNISPAIEALKV